MSFPKVVCSLFFAGCLACAFGSGAYEYSQKTIEDNFGKKGLVAHCINSWDCKPDEHWAFVRDLNQGVNINVKSVSNVLTSLEKKGKLRRVLQGGAFSWELFFKVFLPRYACTALFILCFNPLSILAPSLGFGKFAYSLEAVRLGLKTVDFCCLGLLSNSFAFLPIHSFLATCLEKLKENHLDELVHSMALSYLMLGVFFCMVYCECREPSYLMLVLNSKKLTRAQKEEIGGFLVDFMHQRGIDLKQRGLVLDEDESIQNYREMLTNSITGNEKNLHKKNGSEWVVHWLGIQTEKWVRYGAKSANLRIKSCSALHLAYQFDLLHLCEKIKTLAPESTAVRGYLLEPDSTQIIADTLDETIEACRQKIREKNIEEAEHLSQEVDKMTSERNQKIFWSALFGKIPGPWFAESKLPQDFQEVNKQRTNRQ